MIRLDQELAGKLHLFAGWLMGAGDLATVEDCDLLRRAARIVGGETP